MRRFELDSSRLCGPVAVLMGGDSAERAVSLETGKAVHAALGHRLAGVLAIEEVWSLLMQRPPPWGGSHRDLITLYRNAQGGECPLVIDKSQAPSCGTSSSRFGCWTCTVVEKDRSMEGFIESGAEHLAPLLDFRDWLAETRNDPQRRTLERRAR